MKAHAFLYRMSNDDEVLFEILRRQLVKPGFFQQLTVTPDFLISLIDIPECSLTLSFFGPLPDHKTEYTYSTLHHHDDFILSTISVKGPGYTSLIFKQGYDIDRETGEVQIELEKFCSHNHLKIEFIDKHTAHTIFYPSDLSLTYALWSPHIPTASINSWRKLPIIQKNRAVLKKLTKRLYPDLKTIGVTQYREDYFYPIDGRIRLLPGQIQPPLGRHFAQNVFSKLKYLNFADRKYLENLAGKLPSEDRTVVEPWILRMLNGEDIPVNYEGYDMLVPRRNVHIDEFRKCFSF